MKVKFTRGYPGISGKSDGIVYCYSRTTGLFYARRYVRPEITAANKRVGGIAKNLFRIDPSPEYRNDLSLYLSRYNALRENRNRPVRSWTNLYLKLMYAMAKADPGIDLRTLDREEIILRDLPCLSLKRAVEAGILPAVQGYVSFDHQI